MKYLSKVWADARFYESYGGDGPLWLRAIRSALLTIALDVRSLILCSILHNGHNFVEVDGDPHSGKVIVECTRCEHCEAGYW
jgi:hypothetical protein